MLKHAYNKNTLQPIVAISIDDNVVCEKAYKDATNQICRASDVIYLTKDEKELLSSCSNV